MSQEAGSADFIDKVADNYRRLYPWIDPLDIELGFRMQAAVTARTAAFQRAYSLLGIPRTAGRYAILRITYLSPQQRVSVSEIREQANISAANATVLIDGLEKEGLVIRTPHPTDRRATCIELTSTGRETGAHLIPIMTNILIQLADCLDNSEKLAFIRALERLHERADALFRDSSVLVALNTPQEATGVQ